MAHFRGEDSVYWSMLLDRSTCKKSRKEESFLKNLKVFAKKFTIFIIVVSRNPSSGLLPTNRTCLGTRQA